MLDAFHAIAKRVHRARLLLWILALGACIAFAVGLFVASGTALFLGALVVLLWAMLMLAAAEAFVRPVPVIDPESGYLARLRARFWRAYLRLLAIATVVLCALVVYVSIRAIGMIAGGGGG